MRNETHTVGELVTAFFKAAKGTDFIDSQKIINSWSLVVGNVIAEHTLDISYSKNTLFVRVDSDVLRNEMNYSRSSLMRALNSIVGRELIKNIYFN